MHGYYYTKGCLVQEDPSLLNLTQESLKWSMFSQIGVKRELEGRQFARQVLED